MALMTGSRFFAEAMQAYGVTHIFFVPTMLLPALVPIPHGNGFSGAVLRNPP
jgi:hypothetical protein